MYVLAFPFFLISKLFNLLFEVAFYNILVISQASGFEKYLRVNLFIPTIKNKRYMYVP
jgi:hypothetical protein